MKKNIFFLSLVVITFCSSCRTLTSSEPTLETNIWSKATDIPSDLRFSADVVTIDNAAYLLPGKGGSRFATAPEILKFTNNFWSEVATYDGFARAGSSGSWIHGDDIFILGGRNRSNAPTDEVRSFSTLDNSFRDETVIPSGESFVSTAFTDNRGYIIDLNGFSSYEFSSNTWQTKSPFPINDSFPLMTTEKNIIYALSFDTDENNFYSFDESSNEWSSLPDFPGGRENISVIVSTESHVYTGLNNTNVIWRYDIETRLWEEFTQYPGKIFHSGFAFELNGNLFFGGGYIGDGPISTDSLNNEVYRLNLN